MKPLEFLGRNSLLYLYVHFPLILILKHFRIVHRVAFINAFPFLIWILALILTYAVMYALLPIGRVKWLARLFDLIPAWVVMIALILGAGLLIRNQNVVLLVEVLLGLVFALFFPHLSAALKQRTAPAQ